MNQLERIAHMEKILNEASAVVDKLSLVIERYGEILPRIRELEAYYTGPQWMSDYEDDCAGRLPEGLARGVLSEDAVFDLLRRIDELNEQMRFLTGASEIR